MGEENGPPAAPSPDPELMVEFMFAPATLRSLDRRDGGRTMSRRAFGEVVKGCPPESRVSSRSYLHERLNHVPTKHDAYLIHNIEILFQNHSRDVAKVLVQDINKSLKERERKQGID
jgi:hypothetical protein